MGLSDGLRGRPDDTEGGQGLDLPWDRHPSIHEHIKTHLDPDRPGLTEDGESLPDEERIAGKHQIRWAAGAMDGVTSHHVGGGQDEPKAQRLVDQVAAFCQAPTVQNKRAVYQTLLDDGVLSLVDAFMEKLQELPNLDRRRLFDLAYSLATESPDRGPVKLGVAILGHYRGPGLAELFHTLGRHDEFTLYCAVALASTSETPEQDLWKLARNVGGWGRIHAVERLADTEDAEIKDWLLREGYRNSIMNEYLAHTCATTGGLLAALQQEQVDEPLLNGAGDILVALIASGPAAGMDQYEEGAAAADAYLEHMESRATTLPQFNAVVTIRDWLANNQADWEARSTRDWTPEHRTALSERCHRILARPDWQQKVMEGMQAADNVLFAQADQAAKVLGLDTHVWHWERLQRSPVDSSRWYSVMQAADDQRIGPILALAEQALPLPLLGSGPALESGLGGLGAQYQPHACLGFILQELGRFPGQGMILVQTGLRGPVIRNRHMAARALSQWGQERWPPGMREALAVALACEPDEKVRKSLQKTMEGEALA